MFLSLREYVVILKLEPIKYMRYLIHPIRSLFLLMTLMVSVNAIAQTYRVTGGGGVPLLVENNTAHKIEVYLVNGLAGVEISYTSASSTSHQWKKYTEKALEATSVTNVVQNGTTSTITNIENNTGYFVQEGELSQSRFVFILDYSQYAFSIQSLRVLNDYPCEYVRLEGDASMPKLEYRQPNGGPKEIKREFELSYQTLEWVQEMKGFTNKRVEKIVENPFTTIIDSLFSDTEFTLYGDMFADHFKIGKSITSDLYQTSMVEAYADTTILSIGSSDDSSESESFSAPLTMLFTGYGNEPVATMYIWTIYEIDNPENPLLRYPGAEVEYTFEKSGKYAATLEVSSPGKCSKTIEIENIGIMESSLRIPNAFSPGTTPGINDVFKVSAKSLIRFRGWIFNRWGNQLFYWDDPTQGWDGKYKGKYVAPGAYYYVIEAEGSDGTKYKRKGDVSVFRPKEITE